MRFQLVYGKENTGNEKTFNYQVEDIEVLTKRKRRNDASKRKTSFTGLIYPRRRGSRD